MFTSAQCQIDWKLTFNSVGIGLNIIGVLWVYWYSPINVHTIEGGNLSEEGETLKEIVEHRNRYLRIGLVIVTAGSICQLISNFI